MKRIASLLLLLSAAGCMESLDKQAQKDPNSIIGKTTQNIGEFKPEAGAQVSETKLNATDPISAPVGVLTVAIERTSQLKIEAALNYFNAEHGRYPESYEEFMEQIVKPQGIQLPVLPGGKQYQYDVANHKLQIVDAQAAPAAP